jgi:DNA-binding NtrC family response regulator
MHQLHRRARVRPERYRDGEEATRHWHESGPGLIITDIHMPRKTAKNLTLLGVAKMLGSFTTVEKPFTLEEMVKTVEHAVGR